MSGKVGDTFRLLFFCLPLHAGHFHKFCYILMFVHLDSPLQFRLQVFLRIQTWCPRWSFQNIHFLFLYFFGDLEACSVNHLDKSDVSLAKSEPLGRRNLGLG